MEKNLKRTIKMLAQEDRKAEVLGELIREEMKGAFREMLEEIGVVEREAHNEETGDVGNGYYERNLRSSYGEIEGIKVPRSRKGGFHPFWLTPYKRVSYDLEEIVVAMYEGGCSTRDISRSLHALLGGRYRPSWVSRVTHVVHEKVETFRNRPLKTWYPIIFLDGVILKIRRGSVEGEVVYVAMGISEEGHKEILGFWLMGAEGESATNWEEVLRELKDRGLHEPLLFIGDGLKGLGDAAKKVYPLADFQSCILHKIRSSLAKVRRRDREAFALDLEKVYRVQSEDEFKKGLEALEAQWGRLYTDVIQAWWRDLPYLTTFLAYPFHLRPTIYTTNPLERFMKEIKRRTKVIEVFPDPRASAKVLFLVSDDMNQRYASRKLKYSDFILPDLLSLREVRYGNQSDQLPHSHTQTS